MMKQICMAIAGLVALAGGEAVNAADLIEGYMPPPPRHHKRVVMPVVTYVDCSLLRVDYRPPNPPRSEIVQVCYPPLNLSPRADINRRGQFRAVGY
ncbi:hypothetical protein [Rhizobium sp. CC-YZS058]|uniref:hypothetical protein n=1 Tax=Rhizobium sp. CC-YZS058 TaxID=3042153 RepID=UPI002B059B9D|nr:hypothetical protein [Rhizobium sp. CC-YZS058]MEA3535465.1 hypothetical protein [Rhizobium sp. CC-YZS058]